MTVTVTVQALEQVQAPVTVTVMVTVTAATWTATRVAQGTSGPPPAFWLHSLWCCPLAGLPALGCDERVTVTLAVWAPSRRVRPLPGPCATTLTRRRRWLARHWRWLRSAWPA